MAALHATRTQKSPSSPRCSAYAGRCPWWFMNLPASWCIIAAASSHSLYSAGSSCTAASAASNSCTANARSGSDFLRVINAVATTHRLDALPAHRSVSICPVHRCASHRHRPASAPASRRAAPAASTGSPGSPIRSSSSGIHLRAAGDDLADRLGPIPGDRRTLGIRSSSTTGRPVQPHPRSLRREHLALFARNPLHRRPRLRRTATAFFAGAISTSLASDQRRRRSRSSQSPAAIFAPHPASSRIARRISRSINFRSRADIVACPVGPCCKNSCCSRTAPSGMLTMALHAATLGHRHLAAPATQVDQQATARFAPGSYVATPRWISRPSSKPGDHLNIPPRRRLNPRRETPPHCERHAWRSSRPRGPGPPHAACTAL